AWQVGLLLAALTFLVAPINVVFSTYETRVVPDAIYARVSNAIDFGASLLRPIGGPLLAGIAAAAYGAPTAMLLYGIPLVALVVSAHLVKGLYVLNQPIDEIIAVEPAADDDEPVAPASA